MKSRDFFRVFSSFHLTFFRLGHFPIVTFSRRRSAARSCRVGSICRSGPRVYPSEPALRTPLVPRGDSKVVSDKVPQQKYSTVL